jgi:membrane-bound lytic murein transglycosylase B
MPGGPRLLTLVVVALLGLGVAGMVLGAASDGERHATPRAREASRGPPRQQGDALPAPDSRIATGPRTLAARLASTSAALDGAIDRWRVEHDPSRGGPPRDVALLALHQQRIYRLLTDRPAVSRAVLARVPRGLRPEARDTVLAARELGRIHSVHRGPAPKIRVGRAEPADVLLRSYRAAWRRFGVGPPLLAAVHFVESAFGRLRNRSVSGAQGPMQFMPATWRVYGLGGDVHRTRDAILGAANYLHAAGAPGDERGALAHYNPSRWYVSAVSRYARRIRADPRAFYAYYAWQVYVGDRRVTEPPG